jgi:hypothetical protein
MALDLIFGRTRRSWARGSEISRPASSAFLMVTMTDEVTLRLTEPEIAMLSEMSATKMRADAGDRAAQKKMRGLAKRMRGLEERARRGDAAARRSLLVLRESGVFQPTQTINMTGMTGMGGEQVSNQSYRIAVLRQARRLAGPRPPTTLDFFRAKSAVDGTMRKAGISLYLPGSRPGRVTAGAAPVVDGLPHPDPLSAEQKEDLRTYLRHLPPPSRSQVADGERMTRQIVATFGPVKDRARLGDLAALEKWRQLVDWTNRAQQEALKNQAGALVQLQQLSRANLFNPRFRTAT